MTKRKKEKMQLAAVEEIGFDQDGNQGLFWDRRPPRKRESAVGSSVRLIQPLTFADLQSMIESNKDEIELVMN